MKYDVIAMACEQLDYRDKLRLAQLLIQLARKEEEAENPQQRIEPAKETKPEQKAKEKLTEPVIVKFDKETISYVKERIIKLKPTKKKSLSNSISAMFQFQGGISENDLNKIIQELQRQKVIKIENNRVSYQ